jgi:hypothetical protein
MTKSMEELIASIDREIRLRDFVYPTRVTQGKMKAEKANHELTCMREIAELLRGHKRLSTISDRIDIADAVNEWLEKAGGAPADVFNVITALHILGYLKGK